MENLKKSEKAAYVWAALGQGAVYAMMSSWLVRFYTDALGLTGVFVAALMWSARIWDACTDPMMGLIVDRTRTKLGKMRPYLIIGAPLASAFTILLFIKPNFGQTGLMIYAAITYIVWGMLYTIADVPFWGMPSAMTTNSGERAKFISNARTMNSIGAALPLVLVAIVSASSILGITKGYLLGAIIFAVLGGTLYTISFFKCKERIEPPKEKPTVKESFHLIKQNKPLLLAMLVGILAFGRYLIQGAISYAADYVFVTDGFIKNNIVLISAALIGIGMFPAMLIMPKLYKRFNYKQIVIGAALCSFAVGVIFFFVGFFTKYNGYIALPFLFISGLPLGVFNVITYAIIADSVDYLNWKTGQRAEGLSFSAQTFINKFGSAISAGLIPLILSITNYKPPENDVIMSQDDGTKLAIFLMITLIPAISILLSAIPMLFYDYIGEKKENILKELTEREQAKNQENGGEESVCLPQE